MDFDRSMVAEAVVVAVLPILAKSAVAVNATGKNPNGMSILFSRFIRGVYFTCSGIGGGGGKSLSAFIC